jgi:hypothetical protein
MSSRSTRFAVPILIALFAACGGDEPPETPAAMPDARPAAPVPFSRAAGAALPRGTCEPATGAIVNRAGLHGAMYTIDPVRQVLILYDANGSLRIYRDQVAGRTGYVVRIDMDADSGWAMDKTTGARLTGPAGDFITRAEFGPPLALADSVRLRCGVGPAPTPGG